MISSFQNLLHSSIAITRLLTVTVIMSCDMCDSVAGVYKIFYKVRSIFFPSLTLIVILTVPYSAIKKFIPFSLTFSTNDISNF